MVSIELKPMPDEFGFIYGMAYRGRASFIINVMPPLPLWQGGMKLEGYEPHETDWVLYLEGEEVARVQNRAEVDKEFLRVLTEG